MQKRRKGGNLLYKWSTVWEEWVNSHWLSVISLRECPTQNNKENQTYVP